MRRTAFLSLLVCLAFLTAASTSQAANGIAKLTLSPKDVEKGVTADFKVQTDKIDLTADQKKALAENPMIDSAVGPFVSVDFTVKGTPVAEAPLALDGKAALLIPFGTLGETRPYDLDAFIWDGADKQWRLAGGTFRATADQHFEVASDTEIYPPLGAMLVKPARLGPLFVFKKAQLAGPLADPAADMKKTDYSGKVPGIEAAENAKLLRITTPQFELSIVKATGAVYRYRVFGPKPMDFTPEGLDGLKVYLANKNTGVGGFFDVCRSIDASTEEFQGAPYLVLDLTMSPSADAIAPLAKAHLQYRIGKDITFVRTDMEFLTDDPSAFEVGVYQHYNALDWNRQLFPTIAETLDRPAIKKCFARFSDLEEDDTQPKTDANYFADNSSGGNFLSAVKAANSSTTETEFLRSVAMPWSVVEGNDYFFMYGYLNLQTAMIASPNRFKGVPSFTIQPSGIKKGRTYTFDYFLKFFPKPENSLTDVCKWYAINRYSTDPLSRDYVKFPAEGYKKRKIDHGLFIGDHASTKYDGWMSYDEQFLTTGTWYQDLGHYPPTQYSAEGMKAMYDKQNAEGAVICPYSRQIRSWYAYHDDRPPYKRWRLKAKHGYPFSYGLGSKPESEQLTAEGRLSDDVIKLLGIKPEDGWKLGVHDDFCAPDLVDWYIKQHCDYMDFYKVDGFYFDMGWDTHVSPCFTHPQSGIFHGELKAVAEIAKYGWKSDPPKMFFMNQNIHSPCMYYMDGIFINEGGVGANKAAIDAVKFNRPTFCNLIYDGQWEEFYGKKTFKDQIVLKNMRNLSYGISISDERGEFVRKADDGSMLYKDYIAFCKDINPMSLAYEDDSIIFIDSNPAVTGSVWVDPMNVLVAIYNDSDQPRHVEAMVNLNRMKAYGHSTAVSPGFTIVGLDGTQKEANDFQASNRVFNWVKIEGTLPPQKLLLAK